jgi:hypothetical protein
MRSNLETSARACKIGGRRHQLADATLRAYSYKLDTELDVLLRIAPAHGAGNKLQNVIKGMPTAHVRLPRQSRHPTDQQRLRAGAAALGHLPKGDNCFRFAWAALYADISSVIETGR